jgi:hypothetical protein
MMPSFKGEGQQALRLARRIVAVWNVKKYGAPHSARAGRELLRGAHDRVIGYQAFGALARVVLVTAKNAIGVNADYKGFPTNSSCF